MTTENTAQDAGVITDVQANAFIDFFKKIFSFLGFTAQDAQKIEIGVTTFVKTDLGLLAVDAVEYVEAALPGAAGVDKRDAAIAKLKADAATAGKDLSAFAKSTLIWFVETALQFVVSKGLTAAAAIAIHASEEKEAETTA
jgi:hypothetical protein